MRNRLLVSLLGVALLGCGEMPTVPDDSVAQAQSTREPKSTAVVHMVYLVPADRVIRRDYARGIERAIEHLQIWYHNELGTGKSFTLDKRVVQTIVTPHNASWYANNPRTADPEWLWFWGNVLTEAYALTGFSFNDPDNVWIFYIDADEACNQGVGAAGGVALLPANDLRGLVDETPIAPCTGQPIVNPGVCRWIGGLGHELGHAFGMPHPPACDAGQSSCPTYSLMWLGYYTYPEAYFTAAEKAHLESSAFFSPVKLRSRLPDCAAKSSATSFSSAFYRSSDLEHGSAGSCIYDRLTTALRSKDHDVGADVKEPRVELHSVHLKPARQSF